MKDIFVTALDQQLPAKCFLVIDRCKTIITRTFLVTGWFTILIIWFQNNFHVIHRFYCTKLKFRRNNYHNLNYSIVWLSHFYSTCISKMCMTYKEFQQLSNSKLLSMFVLESSEPLTFVVCLYHATELESHLGVASLTLVKKALL